MTFYEWLVEDESTYNVDEEYYMVKAWNAALDEAVKAVGAITGDNTPELHVILKLKQSKDVF